MLIRSVHVLSVAVLCLALASCGGGGSGSGPAPGPIGSLVLSTNTVDFSTADPSVTPQQQLISATLSGVAAQTVYLRIDVANPPLVLVTGVTVTGATTGQATLVPATAQSVGIGLHTTTLTVTACTTSIQCTTGVIGTPQTVTVTYTVNGATADVARVDYSLTLHPQAADYARTVRVSAYPSFTATSSVPWLAVTPASGTSASADLSASLSAALVDAMDSGTQTGQVQITVPGGNTLTIPVTLGINKPQLDQSTPYVALAGVADTVTARGLGLDQLPQGNGIDLLHVPSGTVVQPTSVTVVSATELRIGHPALPAGEYAVRMHEANGTVIPRSTAHLVSVAPASMPSGLLPFPDSTPRQIRALTYDAERGALLLGAFKAVAGTDQSEILRYVFNTSWQAPQSRLLPNFTTLALGADGRDLYASAGTESGFDSTLHRLAPDTLATRSQQTRTGQGDMLAMAPTSKGEMVVMGGSLRFSGGWDWFRFAPKSASFLPMPGPVAGSYSFNRGVMAASGDGLRLVAADNNGSLGFVPVLDYSSSTDTLATNAPFSTVIQMTLNRLGDRMTALGWVLESAQYQMRLRAMDRNWNVLGQMPADVIEHVINSAGTRVYVFRNDGLIHVYDLAAPPVNGNIAEIGSGIPLVADPGYGSSLVKLALAPGDRTLFIAGSNGVVVQPLP
jgi:hypothetical protein